MGEKYIFKPAISTRELSKKMNEMSRDKSLLTCLSFRSLLDHHFSTPAAHPSRSLSFSRGSGFLVIF